jgi:uncharacterized protein YbjQ (UPF0145 family)
MYFYKYIFIMMLLVLDGCTSKPIITSDGKKVVIHEQYSNLVSDCKKLGSVTADSEYYSIWAKENRQQALNILRDKAFKIYGADTVVLLREDVTDGNYNLQGVALKCYDDK